MTMRPQKLIQHVYDEKKDELISLPKKMKIRSIAEKTNDMLGREATLPLTERARMLRNWK